MSKGKSDILGVERNFYIIHSIIEKSDMRINFGSGRVSFSILLAILKFGILEKVVNLV